MVQNREMHYHHPFQLCFRIRHQYGTKIRVGPKLNCTHQLLVNVVDINLLEVT
jgi:hypothetical protein